MNSLVKGTKVALVGPDGQRLRTLGVVDATVQLKGEKQQLPLYVLENIKADYDMILGIDGLKAFGARLDFKGGIVVLEPGIVSSVCLENSSKLSKLNVENVDMGVLSEKQKKELFSLLNEFKDLFEPIVPGSAKGVVHEIEVEEGIKPIFQKPYPMPFSKKDTVKREIEKMLESGVIRPSKSPWSSPIVLVLKKDGSNRFCVDYTKLNRITKRDQFPLPNIDQVLRQVDGAKYFSSLDLASGYWQIPMKDDDAEKTAFTTDDGHFEFIVLPFGLSNAPATFQRYMSGLLRDIKQTKCYIDDILVFTQSWEEHLQALRLVFETMRAANVRFKQSKCHFGKSSMKWVGHVIDSDGIRVDPDKTSAIEKFPTPQNEKELKRFLGMANYYRKFIKDFATIASPLYELTKKGVTWQWSVAEVEAFETLKKRLVSTDVLINPDFSKPYRFYADASDIGMGGVLCQMKNGEERPIAYASQHFNKRELNYAPIEKEAAAIIWALRKFHLYLHGSKFSVLSDHKPLKWLCSRRDATGRIGRWQCSLLEFEGLEGLEHIKGKENVVADALSRVPEILAFNQDIQTEDLKREQELDEAFQRLKGEMKLDHGVWRKGNLVFVPRSMIKKVIRSFHGNGIHFGMTKTMQLMSYTLFWPGMRKDIEDFIRCCEVCTLAKTTKPQSAPVQSLPCVKKPFERIALDYCGPFPLSKNGNKYILVIIDHFSRFVRAFPVETATSFMSVKCLKKLMMDEGTPFSVLTDRGTHFTGETFEKFLRENGINHLYTSPYHPQCDGMAERQMRTIKQLVRADLLERTDFSSSSWDENVERIVAVMNRTIHPATGHSPFSLVRGRSCAEIRFPWLNVEGGVKQVKVPWSEISKRSEETLEAGRSKVNRERSLRSFSVGDLVWRKVQNPGTLRSRYDGPFKVINKIGNVNYKVQAGHVTQVLHVDHLIPARKSDRILIPNKRGRPRRGM